MAKNLVAKAKQHSVRSTTKHLAAHFMQKPSPSTSTSHPIAKFMQKPSPSTSRSHPAAKVMQKPAPSTSTSHPIAKVMQKPSPSTSTSHLAAEDIAAIREAKQFGIDNDIDCDKEDAAAVDGAMISLPTKLFGIRLVDQTSDFYYDEDEI